MFEYLESNPSVFYAVFFLILAFNALAFFVGGKRAESRFPSIKNQKIVFREKGASGHSKASLITSFGGSRKTLDIVVTDKELWIKGILPMFSFIGSKYDLLHKVPLTNIKMVENKGGVIDIKFVNEKGLVSHIELTINDSSGFVNAVKS